MRRAYIWFIFLLIFPSAARACLHDCRVDSTGYLLIKNAEGFSPFIYKDSAGIPTIGFGHAIRPGEAIQTPMTGPEALALLQSDVAARTGALNRLVIVPLAPQQFDALASFGYNVGMGNLQRSTLLKRVNAARHDEVHPQFLLWNKAGGEVLTGLRVRREAEADLYDSGIGK